MFKKIFSLMVLLISVLIVNLLTSHITDYIIHYKLELNPYKFTGLAMLVLVFILVPCYRYMSTRIEIIVAKILLSGSNSFGRSLGLLISFAIVISILFAIYLQEWFQLNILVEIKEQLF